MAAWREAFSPHLSISSLSQCSFFQTSVQTASKYGAIFGHKALSPLSVNLGPFYSTMGAPSPRAPVASDKGIGSEILFMCPRTQTRGRPRNRHKTPGTKIQISPSMHLYHKGKRAPAVPASAGGGGGGKMKYRRSRVIYGTIHI